VSGWDDNSGARVFVLPNGCVRVAQVRICMCASTSTHVCARECVYVRACVRQLDEHDEWRRVVVVCVCVCGGGGGGG
jgi:hypothetical protein